MSISTPLVIALIAGLCLISLGIIGIVSWKRKQQRLKRLQSLPARDALNTLSKIMNEDPLRKE